ITGDSIFIIKTMSDSIKKLAIVEKSATENTWEFKYANLDGSDEQIVPLNAGTNVDNYFIHYSIDSIKIQEREPAMDDWDLLFTKYYDYTIPYYVTGVLFNDNHIVAQEVRESGMDQSTHNTYEESAFTSNISEIGSDWKKFDMGAMAYVLTDTVVYYLKTYGGVTDSSYFKIYFTGFTGTSEGKYTFMQEKLSLVSSEEHQVHSLLEVYPNPASDHINVLFDLNGRTDIEIIDMTGRRVYATWYNAGGFTNLSLDVGSLNPGVFFIRVSAEGESDVLRFIKE
ncbi:MAG: T9SS type A sorting domain-containing protein, partial [Bacteroidota bacterium]|nr:T9SS type A sorting domain-containing protein [Bacteroidota bacterium]